MSSLTDRTIVVTGAARGMGLEVVRRCISLGATVVAVDVSTNVEDTAGSVGASTAVGDVTDGEFAMCTIDEAVRTTGRVDALVNVAGIHRNGSVTDTDESIWTSVLSVNVTGTYLWCRAALPHMVEQGSGSIVNFGSIVGTHARPNAAAYVTSKAAVLGLTRSIAVDYGPSGIRCNTVSPGSIETPMQVEYRNSGGVSYETQAATNYLRKLGSVSEVAAAVTYLISDEAGFVSGHDLVVDGARTSGI
ncbi:SDR family oxidoreductase [Rhodococcus fascians]|nr:SDR family oxidoreductase [Rhodococcus fascians]MBY4238736.1 SDR family oxidoreductase [Rhodococcus fascians]MBY4254675.1 SDR family oxidoreductase [Rhodococcus fascians]MBY4270091.1 SDR family oxidoreductase [Rhodococcus fascians]